jgi:hypothetical protein
MRVKCSGRSIPKRSGGLVRAWFKFPRIELEAVRLPSEPDLRSIFAFHRGAASAELGLAGATL